MTLTGFQKATIGKLAGLHDKLNNLMNPRMRKASVIITIEIPILIEEDPEEEEVNYKGKLSWDFEDENAFASELNQKILNQIVEEKL